MTIFTRFIKKYFLHRFATPLPRGMAEFDVWSKDIVDVYGFPDNASVRFMLAAILLHLGQTEANKPKRYFGLCGLAAASKEIAHAQMTQLKEAQQKKAAEELAATSGSNQGATVTPITGGSDARPTVS